MDYGNLFSKAWDILWKNKFLIILGVLVALSGAGGGGGNQSRFVFQNNDGQWGNMPSFEFGEPFRDLGLSTIAIGGILALVAVLFLIALALWAVGTLSRGGLISAVNEIELGNPTNFSDAFRAGWAKGWRMIGIGLVPSIPLIILFIAGLVSFVLVGGFQVFTSGDFPLVGMGPFLPLIVLACFLVPLMVILSMFRTFADRACMLEDLSVISAYRRGFEVLGDNLGPAVILFLLQAAISLGIGIMMIIPGILIALCCLLWPLLILISGAFKAFYSILWTLAWREWVSGKEAPASNQ